MNLKIHIGFAAGWAASAALIELAAKCWHSRRGRTSLRSFSSNGAMRQHRPYQI
jgi:hypothetical protein